MAAIEGTPTSTPTVQPSDNARLTEALDKLENLTERLEELTERIEYGLREAPDGGFQYVS